MDYPKCWPSAIRGRDSEIKKMFLNIEDSGFQGKVCCCSCSSHSQSLYVPAEYPQHKKTVSHPGDIGDSAFCMYRSTAIPLPVPLEK